MRDAIKERYREVHDAHQSLRNGESTEELDGVR